jgi:hypothetical protein
MNSYLSVESIPDKLPKRWDNFRYSNIYETGVPGGERRGKKK